MRIQYQPATRDYVARRAAEGKTSREINRCLTRYVARDLYRLLEGGCGCLTKHRSVVGGRSRHQDRGLAGPPRRGVTPDAAGEARHGADQRVGTPPQQHRRKSDRHDCHDRPPGDFLSEGSFEQRRHHRHADQYPVASHPFGRVRGAGPVLRASAGRW